MDPGALNSENLRADDTENGHMSTVSVSALKPESAGTPLERIEAPRELVTIAELTFEAIETLSALFADGYACKNWLSPGRSNLVRARLSVDRILQGAANLSTLVQCARSLGPVSKASLAVDSALNTV